MKISNQASAYLTFGLALCAGIGVSLATANVQTAQVRPMLPGAPAVHANHRALPKPEVFKATNLASSERDLAAEIDSFLELVQDPGFDGNRCAELFSKTYQRLLDATPEDFAVGNVARNNYAGHGTQYIQDLFQARIDLREKLGELAKKGQATQSCVASARDLFRAARVLEDLLGEFALGHPKYNAEKRAPVLRGNAPWLLVNRNYDKLSFRSGDVILSRGTAFSSAAIARIGDADTNLSHLAIVYVDPKTHEISLTEAHIEIGSFSGPLGKYLTDGKVRAIVFRHKDPILAHNAASMIREKISKYQAEHGENLPYDFSMDADEPSALFCSELVSHAFELASGTKASVPMFRSSVNPKNRDFLKRLGVKVHETFLPGDIEFDPNFELVAEWRDYSRLNISHLHDAVLTSMFTWMDRDGYVFHDALGTNVKKKVAWHLRRWPLFSDLLKEKLPKNMSQSTIATVMTLDSISELLFDHLAAKNDEHYQKTGDWLTPKQMSEVLEAYRKTKPAALNALFRPL
jgi:Permuted papain-like amidase enzyme, YaeF/YiiX, C92 family